MFVQRTPNGKLLKELKAIEESLSTLCSRKVKLVEEGGRTLESLLIRPNSLAETSCIRDRCEVCIFDENKGKCRVRSIVYSNTSLTCESKGKAYKYGGESSSSAYERANRHVEEGEKCLPGSHVWQHILQHHKEGIHNIRSKFKFEVI